MEVPAMITRKSLSQDDRGYLRGPQTPAAQFDQPGPLSGQHANSPSIQD
jgi:hypothetical protein